MKRILIIIIAVLAIGIFAFMTTHTEPARYIAPVKAVEYSKRPVNVHLVNAARLNDIGKVSRLLKQGASPDAVDGSTDGGEGEALEAAASHGNLAIVKLLLDNGADINAPDYWGGTALVSASMTGQTQIVKLLLSRGADANVSDDGTTALDYAQNQKSPQCAEIVKMLQQAGAIDSMHIFDMH